MTRKYLPGKVKLVLKFLGLVSILLIYSSNKHATDASKSKALWLKDYNQAITKAKVENKTLLVYFSANEYCPPCRKLNTEIFENELFKDYAVKNLVLLRLIAPIEEDNQFKITPASYSNSIITQEADRTAPLVLLINKQGKIIGRTGYRQGGATAFLNYLKTNLNQK